MKVLHVSASYKPSYVYGGPVFSLSALTEALVQEDVTTDVFTTNANGDKNLHIDISKTYQIEGVTVRYYQRYLGGLCVAPKLISDLWKSCKEYDIVHINSWWNFVSVFACMACLLRRVTPVLSLRGTMSDFSFDNRKVWIKKCIHLCIGRFLLGRSIIHFTSHGEQNKALRWFQPSRFFILRNIIVIPPRTQFTDEAHSGTELVFLGRLHPIKNLEVMIEAVNRLDFPCTLMIYGQGDPEYVAGLKRIAGEKVRWMGWVEGDEKFHVLRKADIMLLMSQYENFGNVVVEALSQGTPVICAKDIGISDFVEAQDMGWTAVPEAAELSNVISLAVTDGDKRKRIREEGPHIVGRSFSAKTLGPSYVLEYQKIAALKKAKNLTDRI